MSKILLCTLMAISSLAASVEASRVVATDPSTSTLARLAAEHAVRQAAGDGNQRSGAEVMNYCLPRFFAIYPFLRDPEERQRVMNTSQRMALHFGSQLLQEAEELARTDGASSLRDRDVASIVAGRLPRRATEYNTIIFFPDRHESEQIEVEIFDLEAFADTGFSWEAAAKIAESATKDRPDALPVDEKAAHRLVSALDDYGLLVFRLAGQHARKALDPYTQSRHLRQADKTLSERARSGGEKAQAAQETALQRAFFADVSPKLGKSFRHVSTDWISRFRRAGMDAPTFGGGGASVGDLDGDEWPDLILCGNGCVIRRNNGDGSFSDITEASGPLHVAGEARMALPADFDNDGDQDVFITYSRETNRLFRNRGDASFEDVTRQSGLERQGDLSRPAIAFDFDNDGLLDIFVGNFGDYLNGASAWVSLDARNGTANRLYRNLGDLKFVDVTEQAGVGGERWAQAISHVDYDLDGDQDIYVANDFGRNELLVNQGDGTFREEGSTTGSDDPFHGMNVSFTDLNRDRYPDIFVTNIWDLNQASQLVQEHNSLLLSVASEDGSGPRYILVSEEVGLMRPDTGWSWTGVFLDADNDGDDDLFVTNGLNDYNTQFQWRAHPDRPGEIYPYSHRGEANAFYVNPGRPPYVRAQAGTELAGRNSRSAALLDYDLDGDLDMVVTTFHSTAHLFRNDGAQPTNGWLTVELVGDPKKGTSLDAIGTQLTATAANGLYVWRLLTGGQGYLTMVNQPLHLGLGQAKEVDLEVVWPGSIRQHFSHVAANQRIRIRQGANSIEVLPASPSKIR